MKVTEVRIKLASAYDNNQVMAYAVVVFDDCFAVHDLKIIRGRAGPFVSMPSRKAAVHCLNCRQKNDCHSHHCQRCGRQMPERGRDEDGRLPKSHYDIVHPIVQEFREYLEGEVLRVYDQVRHQSAAVDGYDIDLDDYERRAPA